MIRSAIGILTVGVILGLPIFNTQGFVTAEPEKSTKQISPVELIKVNGANPRYFVDPNGKPVYLSGSHTHLSLQDREGESSLRFESLLRLLQDHHHNFTKLWVQEETDYSPLPYQRVGRDSALDGKPKFDLTKLNQTYFDELRSRAAAAGARGIYVAVMLFNGWSVEGKSPDRTVWTRHPFYRENNVNGIDGDPDGNGEGSEVHTLSDPAVTAIQEMYVRKVIDSVNDLNNVLYEIENEGAPTAENAAWQHHMINYIHEYERTKPRQHPVGMTVQWPNGSNEVVNRSPAEWMSPGSSGGYETNPPAVVQEKVVLSDTDHLWGNGGNADWVWMSFTRGLNPIFMDVTPPLSQQYSLPQAEEIRRAMRDTLEYAKRIDLAYMHPRQDVCSTTFCLAAPGRQYLVYFPPTRWCTIPLIGRSYKCALTVDLSSTRKQFTVEWFSPDTGQRYTDVTLGGTVQTFVPPFTGRSVLYLEAQPN